MSTPAQRFDPVERTPHQVEGAGEQGLEAGLEGVRRGLLGRKIEKFNGGRTRAPDELEGLIFSRKDRKPENLLAIHHPLHAF